jgi:hypothetical protein
MVATKKEAILAVTQAVSRKPAPRIFRKQQTPFVPAISSIEFNGAGQINLRLAYTSFMNI